MDTEPPRTNRTLLAVVAGIVLLVIVSAVVVFSQGAPEDLDAQSPEGVVQRYAAAVIAGDEEQALTYLTPELRDSCERWNTTLPAESMRVSLLSTTVRDTSADVRVSLVTSYDDGGPFGASEFQSEEEFDLDRIDGAWLIRAVPWPLSVCDDSTVQK